MKQGAHVSLWKYRAYQRRSAVPAAFRDLLTLGVRRGPGSSVVAEPVLPVHLSEEIVPGCPLYRWKRGQYDRRSAAKKRAGVKHHSWVRAVAFKFTLIATSTLALAVVFTLVMYR